MPPCDAVDESCRDSTSWYRKDADETCRLYVSKKTADRCDKKGVGKEKARDACPLTCGECEPCVDSTSCFYKKAKRTCADYVAENPEDRCSKKDASKVKARDACPRTCGEC